MLKYKYWVFGNIKMLNMSGIKVGWENDGKVGSISSLRLDYKTINLYII